MSVVGRGGGESPRPVDPISAAEASASDASVRRWGSMRTCPRRGRLAKSGGTENDPRLTRRLHPIVEVKVKLYVCAEVVLESSAGFTGKAGRDGAGRRRPDPLVGLDYPVRLQAVIAGGARHILRVRDFVSLSIRTTRKVNRDRAATKAQPLFAARCGAARRGLERGGRSCRGRQPLTPDQGPSVDLKANIDIKFGYQQRTTPSFWCQALLLRGLSIRLGVRLGRPRPRTETHRFNLRVGPSSKSEPSQAASSEATKIGGHHTYRPRRRQHVRTGRQTNCRLVLS